ncbi:MAG: YifB family Mg chelatase-like AAA ATPase [Mariprofundaceae bacterium]|nr:YifB family Mg chelatase-like AAA ATPase [Mariprofundaceae bacterium]
MLARLASAALRGLDAEPVDVEVDLSRGLPSWSMVGLAEAAVRESRDRVRAALLNSNFEFPLRHITVNLSPADKRKDGSYFDLPVAIGLLIASGQVQAGAELPFMIGELALDGRINAVNGTLPLALFARAQGFKSIILPEGNADEAAVVAGIEVLPASSLLAVARHLAGRELLTRYEAQSPEDEVPENSPDMADIRGQQQARRALEIAAAGSHHLLLSGPPGVGKSMLAERLPGILPPLTGRQKLEVARIYSISGERGRAPLSAMPPYRAPHHSASDVAMIGGGSVPRPGEVSKAHYGTLFLDELPEYKRQVLEVLRQPLENGHVCIARAADTLEFPAQFQLVAAMNPCPCGYLGHPTRNCQCSGIQVRRYRTRISGPLLDRFDLRVHVPPVEKEELMSMAAGESSAAVAVRVSAARQRQYARQGDGVVNARLTPSQLEAFAMPDAEGVKLLDAAMSRFSLSARSYHRILKVARTIADIESEAGVSGKQIAEALQYRGEEDDG